jgi:hypothetical protein
MPAERWIPAAKEDRIVPRNIFYVIGVVVVVLVLLRLLGLV